MERSGAGDPARTLDLLWRHRAAAPARPARGRRPRFAVDQIVAAAVAVADRDGLAAMSMERVAEELGAGTMSLYTHIPGKAELLDLMVDAVLAERDLPGPGDPAPECWRARVELYAERTRAVHRRHPWLGQVSTVRPPLGPGTFAEEEFLIAAFAGIGLPPERVSPTAGAVAAFVGATAAAEAAAGQAERESGQSEDAWWAARQAFWRDHFDEARYPAVAALWRAGGLDREAPEARAAVLCHGLGLLLDGIEACVRRSAAGPGGPGGSR